LAGGAFPTGCEGRVSAHIATPAGCEAVGLLLFWLIVFTTRVVAFEIDAIIAGEISLRRD